MKTSPEGEPGQESRPMKALAAHRAGLATVILPKRNERHLDELPDDVRETMIFVLTETIDEVLAMALRPAEEQTCSTGSPDIA